MLRSASNVTTMSYNTGDQGRGRGGGCGVVEERVMENDPGMVGEAVRAWKILRFGGAEQGVSEVAKRVDNFGHIALPFNFYSAA